MDIKQMRNISIEYIERSIYLIRGHKVMLDRDLARLYDVETRALNQAVRRNQERFPEDFMIQLTRSEIQRISQSVTSLRVLKYSKSVQAFTEHGVAMLSSTLNSPRAIQVNIQIMRTFARLREIISNHRDLVQRLNQLEGKYDAQFKVVFDAIRRLITPPIRKPHSIGFLVKGS